MPTFEGIPVFYTPAAVLFHGVYWEAPLWLPLSQIEMIPDGEVYYVVHVKAWLTQKNDLREFTFYTAEEIAEKGPKND